MTFTYHCIVNRREVGIYGASYDSLSIKKNKIIITMRPELPFEHWRAKLNEISPGCWKIEMTSDNKVSKIEFVIGKDPFLETSV